MTQQLVDRMFGLLILPHDIEKFESRRSRYLHGTLFDLSIYLGISSGISKDDSEASKLAEHVFGFWHPTSGIEKIRFNDEYSYQSFSANLEGKRARVVICRSFPYLNTCFGRKLKTEGMNTSKGKPQDWTCAATKILSAAVKDFGHLYSQWGVDFLDWVRKWELTEISGLKDVDFYKENDQAPSCYTCQKYLPCIFDKDLSYQYHYHS